MLRLFAAAILLSAAGVSLALALRSAPLQVGPDEVFGPDPALAAPKQSWLPEVNVATAVGWPEGEKPVAGEGLKVTEFASGLEHPRWLYRLPNGDILVAESNAPKKEKTSWRTWVMQLFMAKAGAGVPSANRISLLKDADGDGKAERSTFVSGLNSPFGMALVGDTFYVANTDAIVRFSYQPGATALEGTGEVVAKLPAGPRNHHWTKNIIASADGKRLYVTIGSNSNAGENGLGEEQGRAAIWEVNLSDGATRSFATGLRNPNGLDFAPGTDQLWTVVNERDELGDNLVPDYLTSVKPGGFYGWPFAYFGQNVDTRVPLPEPGIIAKALKPDYALGAHTASLGLAFSDGKTLDANYASGAFIGQHGSWNRSVPAGYRVIFVPFAEGQPSGSPRVVLGGFLNDAQEARGRPVGVILDGQGGLLVADDAGNKIWRVSAAGTP